MPVVFGRLKTKGRPLSVMAHLKWSIIEVKAETECFAHVLIIVIANATKDPTYKAYGKGRKIISVVEDLLEMTGIVLDNGAGVPELERLRTIFANKKS